MAEQRQSDPLLEALIELARSAIRNEKADRAGRRLTLVQDRPKRGAEATR